LVEALAEMAKAAQSENLEAAFHLEQTREHVSRLEEIFEDLDESPKGRKCKGMEGLIEESHRTIAQIPIPERWMSAFCGRAPSRTLCKVVGPWRWYLSARTDTRRRERNGWKAHRTHCGNQSLKQPRPKLIPSTLLQKDRAKPRCGGPCIDRLRNLFGNMC
jgi:Domain of unknown function (DUF892)